MENMSLGNYTFEWNPDRWTPPDEERDIISSPTLGRVVDGKVVDTVAVYSFGVRIVGKAILLEWDMMPVTMFDSLQVLYVSDQEQPWVPGDGYLYTVEIMPPFLSAFFDSVGLAGLYRKDVKMSLLIKDRTVVS